MASASTLLPGLVEQYGHLFDKDSALSGIYIDMQGRYGMTGEFHLTRKDVDYWRGEECALCEYARNKVDSTGLDYYCGVHAEVSA